MSYARESDLLLSVKFFDEILFRVIFNCSIESSISFSSIGNTGLSTFKIPNK